MAPSTAGLGVEAGEAGDWVTHLTTYTRTESEGANLRTRATGPPLASQSPTLIIPFLASLYGVGMTCGRGAMARNKQRPWRPPKGGWLAGCLAAWAEMERHMEGGFGAESDDGVGGCWHARLSPCRLRPSAVARMVSFATGLAWASVLLFSDEMLPHDTKCPKNAGRH